MAVVTVKETGKRYTRPEEIREFLIQFGVEYDRWDISPIPPHLLAKKSLTAEEKDEILRSLHQAIDEAKQRAGYQSADLVCLWPEVPNLDVILAPFQREHYHTENEIRFVVDGNGTFSINPRRAPGVFDVNMDPGDLISVPAGTWHWFNLGESRRIKTVRIFESADGWSAIYPDEAVKAS